MSERCFTPFTARDELERLRPSAERMRRLYHALARRRPERVVPDQPVEPAYFLLLAHLQVTLSEIGARGVQVRDIGRGRLAFPARREGRPVLLCWEVGEPEIRFWRDPSDSGKRRRVDEDGRWDEA